MTTTTAPAIKIGSCVFCNTTYRIEMVAGRIVTELGGATPGYCGCRAAAGWPDSFIKFGKDVAVTYAPEVTCGNRCYIAKSTTCTCSCGGEQHGKAHERSI